MALKKVEVLIRDVFDDDLRQMWATATDRQMSLPVFLGEVLETQVAEFRALRIPPSREPLVVPDPVNESDELDEDPMAPTSRKPCLQDSGTGYFRCSRQVEVFRRWQSVSAQATRRFIA